VRASYPDGTFRGAGGPDAPTLEIVRPRQLFERLGSNPKIGLGEGYMAGDWRAAPGTDLAELLTPFAERVRTLVPAPMRRLRSLVGQHLPQSARNTLDGARRNIHAHYDLSNELFAAFLDPTMSYSAALFDDDLPFVKQDLEQAQRRKIDAVLDLAGVGAGTRMLEIGTGWGALAIAAGRRGAEVTSVTLSEEQLVLARDRLRAAGVADRVRLELADYREVTGSYETIVSVEMIEAVGEEFWPDYFTSLDRLLAPGGTVALQAILMDHDRLLATRDSHGWIQKYIFPGGLIPSLHAIEQTAAAHTRLRVDQHRHFGASYAETLRRWRHRFLERWPHVAGLGFDETFRRMWEFYLAYSEAGFAAGYLDVARIRLTRAGR
jgi:cyclopropane-fatty-acyl-phospholipid synthase